MESALVINNLGLIKYAIGKLPVKPCIDDYDDIAQIGCIGLIKAANNFKPELGYQFSTYASCKIFGEIRKNLRDNRKLHVSRNIKSVLPRLHSAISYLSNELQREPTNKEIAEYTNLSEENVRESLDYELNDLFTVSLDAAFKIDGKDSDNPLSYGDKVASNYNLENETIDKLDLELAINQLPEIQRNIIKLRYLEDLPQHKIGKILGISQVRVSRLERKALESLRKLMM